MQLMPKPLVGNIGGQYLKDSKTVVFHPNPCEALDALSKVMSSGFVSFRFNFFFFFDHSFMLLSFIIRLDVFILQCHHRYVTLKC